MTGLRSRKNRKQLFQNLKMGFKIAKMMKKLLHSEGNVFEDIVEVIVELKIIIYYLEEIGRKVLNETDKFKDDTSDGKNTIIEDKSSFQTMKCNFCDSKFETISDLERHIMEQHEKFETFDCDSCNKGLFICYVILCYGVLIIHKILAPHPEVNTMKVFFFGCCPPNYCDPVCWGTSDSVPCASE